MSNYPKRKPKLNRYDLKNDYGIGYTSKGEEFYFDLEDYEKIRGYTWCKDGNHFCANIDGVKFRLHRFIMNCPDGMVVDHINHDQRDNRKINLRICTRAENNHNRTPKTGECCGIAYRKENQKWYSRIGGRFLGYFLTKEEAVEARRIAEKEEFGEYSYMLSIERGKLDERITEADNS